MGQTWRRVGDILTAPWEGLKDDWLNYSGAEYEAGPADFNFYVDQRGGYFYITCWNSTCPRTAG